MKSKRSLPLLIAGGALAFASVACAQNGQMNSLTASPAPMSPAALRQALKLPALRAPAVPLVTHDPYFSLWSGSNELNAASTMHWTGRSQSLSSLIRIDGRTFRLMGDTPANLPTLPQTDVQILPTRTIYTFAGSGVQVRLTFTSPLLPEDLDLMSRPLSYLTWDVSATDGATHDASLYFDASSAITVNDPNQRVTWKREKSGDLTSLRIGSQDQPVLGKTGDDLRIDWGYLYLAAPNNSAPRVLRNNEALEGAGEMFSRRPPSFALGSNAALEASFAGNGTLPASDDTRGPRAVSDGEPVAAVSFPLGRVGNQAVSRTAMLAYDDVSSIRYMGRDMQPYWKRGGADALALLRTGALDYAAISRRCAAFDAELMTDLNRIGGAKYAQLGALSHRQALAAQKIVADAGGQPLSFSKENNSGGFIATVDVMYPAAPQMIAMSPSLLRATLQPIMAYSSSGYWKFPYAPHDLGTYPKATGQTYGGGERTEDNQMPVEESGNMLILLAALSKVEGNTQFINLHWPTMTRWANYLADKGFDPESQLSTDDFAGHLAHNINLSAKAIVALGAYSQMAQMRGETATATKFRGLATRFAAQWVKEAEDGDHLRLAFDQPGTWSQKYNLVWDNILGLNLFPASVYAREMAYYKTKLNRYGLPLDSRRTYTKLDWEIWTATLTGKRADFEAIMDPITVWMNETTSRVPLTDFYDTIDGRQQNFKARSVVGGVFIPMLKDAAMWKKWAARDTGLARKIAYAPLPVRPTYREIVQSGQNQAGINWKYTLNAPPNNWFAPNFNDSAWKTGEAGFGTGGTPGIVVRTPWNTSDIWMRRTFTFNGTPPTRAQIYGMHDDEAEIYLNGKLVASLGGYNAAYEALATIPAGLLRKGENVLAVHGHQGGGGQGIDISIAQEIPGGATTPQR